MNIKFYVMQKQIDDLQQENKLIVSYNQQLLKENAELKSQLKGTTHCYDEVEHRQLKKQLEELEESSAKAINKQVSKGINLLNQQREFINYLENEINKWHYNFNNIDYEQEIEEPSAEDLIEEILQKYKEIIGASDD